MHTDLRHFLRPLLGVIAATLVPVLVTAFLSVPMSLGRHPGEPMALDAGVERHMT